MFALKNGKKKKRYIDIYSNNCLIYQGRWDDLPLLEELIIEKSIAFFNDPEPCYIHRDAVRVRLLAELEAELIADHPNIPIHWLDKLASCTGVSSITFAEFSEK
ncbi:MAG: hypothetical protein WCD89_25875 [Anaerocolumna sp.]